MLGFSSSALDLSFCFRLPYDLIFLEIIVESKVLSYLQQSCTHIQAALSTWDQKVFHKKCEVFVPAGVFVVLASQLSFFFTVALTLDPFILKWWQPQLQPSTTAHSSHFPVTSWLFSASWECFQHHSRHFVGLVVLFMVYSIALKKHGRTTRDHFCFKRYALSGTDEPLPCRGWMLHGHWQRRAHHDSSRRWPRSYYSGRRCTTVNSMQFALILHLYTCVHFSWLWMASYMCIRFYKFFCDRFVCILS